MKGFKGFISRGIASVVALTALGAANSARADLLTSFDALALIQSTATDTDAFFFTLFTDSEATLTYSSSSSATTWTGTLTGPGLSLAYLSTDLSNLPLGPITWTSTGSFGGQDWNGSGSATITETSPTTFDVVFTDAVTLGSNTASINVTIPGTVLSGQTVMFGSPGNEEVTPMGSGFVNGEALSKTIYSYSKNKDGILVKSDVQFVPDDKPPKLFKNNIYDANGNVLPFELNGTIFAVPEPSSVVLLGFGGLALLGYSWRRRSQDA